MSGARIGGSNIGLRTLRAGHGILAGEAGMHENTPPTSRDTMLDIFCRTMSIHHNDSRIRALVKAGKLTIVYYPVRGQEVVAAAATIRTDAEVSLLNRS